MAVAGTSTPTLERSIHRTEIDYDLDCWPVQSGQGGVLDYIDYVHPLRYVHKFSLDEYPSLDRMGPCTVSPVALALCSSQRDSAFSLVDGED